MPSKGAKRKDRPVPIEKLKFSGEAHFIFQRLKAEIAERDQYINRLESHYSELGQCERAVYNALEEAETLAASMAGYYTTAAQGEQTPLFDSRSADAKAREMGRLRIIFREARAAFQKLRP